MTAARREVLSTQIMAMMADNVQPVHTRIAQACAAARPARGKRHVAGREQDLRRQRGAGRHTTPGCTASARTTCRKALEKIAALADLREPIEWHLVGPLQTNKTRVVAENFDWVHSVDRLKIAQRLSEQRPAALPPLNVCLQVNISGEESKSGLAPAKSPMLRARSRHCRGCGCAA